MLKRPKFFKKQDDNMPRNPRKERMEAEERKAKMKRIGRLLFVSWVVLGTLAIFALIYIFFQTYEFRSPIVKKQVEIISPLPDEPEATESADLQSFIPQAEASETMPISEVLYEGKVSHYSHAGCLGCSENQTMGNGQPFDENAMTIAVPCEDILSGKIVYNTPVKVTNIDTGDSVEAMITDCGGFSKYNRIADLSLGMSKILATKTDVTNIRIVKL